MGRSAGLFSGFVQECRLETQLKPTLMSAGFDEKGTLELTDERTELADAMERLIRLFEKLD